MDMKLDIKNTNLFKAVVARDKEIFADPKDRQKKKNTTKDFKKKSNKVSYTSVFEDFHSVDLFG